MFEKVNPSHPDKIADRIAGALVDLAYKKQERPTIAVECLIGHGSCYIITESSVDFFDEEIESIVYRIAGKMLIISQQNSQDPYLANNQQKKIRCGDNGIFKGVPLTTEEAYLGDIAKNIYNHYGTDGKYIINHNKLIICQSNSDDWLKHQYQDAIVNPLGDWTGGLNVDSGATNRKLGSDMGNAVTGGGLHGKDLSKADVSVNIYAYLQAQRLQKEINLCCAIGDESVDGKPYTEIVAIAENYIKALGGFEKFAEWGLI